MNYRHATPRAADGQVNLANPYEAANAGETMALDSCCICMEDFESGPAESDRVVDNELGNSGN